jgi:hypothetical protein
MPVLVDTAVDWQKVSQIGGPVVDLMILRCGEIFLLGPNVAFGQVLVPQPYGTNSQYDVWQLLEVNLQGLAGFFDRIVLQDQIPVFDYPDSFMVDPNFEAAYLERNAERMRYPKFRSQHLFVGSGVIEAGCKASVSSHAHLSPGDRPYSQVSRIPSSSRFPLCQRV